MKTSARMDAPPPHERYALRLSGRRALRRRRCHEVHQPPRHVDRPGDLAAPETFCYPRPLERQRNRIGLLNVDGCPHPRARVRRPVRPRSGRCFRLLPRRAKRSISAWIRATTVPPGTTRSLSRGILDTSVASARKARRKPRETASRDVGSWNGAPRGYRYTGLSRRATRSGRRTTQVWSGSRVFSSGPALGTGSIPKRLVEIVSATTALRREAAFHRWDFTR